MSKKQLAEKLDISINTVGKWWRNREPSPEYATKIQTLLQELTVTESGVSDMKNAAAVRDTTRKTSSDHTPQVEYSNWGHRFFENSIIVSIQRTKCPQCNNPVEKFHHCTNCGQHLVWANVPSGNPS